MAEKQDVPNRVKARRTGRGWSQAELARRAGISRTAVSAIEVNRLVPSVAAALALAAALDGSVEELFGSARPATDDPAWAWPARQEPCRFWQARVGGLTRLYPVEATPLGVVGHDGICRAGVIQADGGTLPEETLVLACCDPAAGLLAAAFNRATGFRLLVLPRSSGQALTLLKQGLIHVAGVHLSTTEDAGGNVAAVKEHCAEGMSLLRVARWEEGLALSPGVTVRSVETALKARLAWVGREPGSGARQCLEQLLRDRPVPRRLAYDHRGVAEAIRCGWAEAGVCLRLTSEEAGLRFLGIRFEGYDLCFPQRSEADPRIRALIRVVRSRAYRKSIGDLPGYDAGGTGEVEPVGIER